MLSQPTPYQCHLLVCTNDRKGERVSCADGENRALKDRLKAEVEARGWQGRVRVSSTGCLGVCARGPNVMLYPQGIWWNQVRLADAEEILRRVAEFVQD